MEDIRPKVDYWKNVVVCYILGVKPPYRIVDGSIRRIWRKYGVDKVLMMKSGLFVVRFHSLDCKNQAMDVGPILYDSTPVVVEEWTPNMDLNVGNIRIVPTWITLPNLPLHKSVGMIGKPLRTYRATARKDILEFARVLVEMSMDQDFPNEIMFCNENGKMISQ